jgi:4-hydroxy-2-oxoheptanedioate aldolase
MIPNRLKALWAEGKPTINGWCSIGNTFTAEIMAAQGFDSVTIDMQHGALDYSHLLPMFQAMRASGATLMARVPWLEPGIIMKALDAGAYGIICPMVNTAEEAARFVSYMRYPPLGQRSFGPTRVSFAAGANYAGEANANLLAWAMIETADGMANLDAIAATPGLDGLYVGPADLTLSLTQGRLAPGFDREEPEMIAALQTIVAACRKNGLRAALHCGTPDYAARAIGWGFDMTTVGGDARFLAAAAGAAVAGFRKLTDGGAEISPGGPIPSSSSTGTR